MFLPCYIEFALYVIANRFALDYVNSGHRYDEDFDNTSRVTPTAFVDRHGNPASRDHKIKLLTVWIDAESK